MIFAVRENWKPELACLERFVSPGSVVVDAGACLGIYTIAAGKLVGESGRVLSFEPGVESFPVLERNIKLNCLRNIRAFRMALSNSEGKARLYHNVYSITCHSLGADPQLSDGFEEVATTTIDRVLEQEGIDRVDFLKMDVEGSEELVLRGARSLLRRARPVILFEINPKAIEQLGLTKYGTWNILDGLGYHFFSLGSAGKPQKLDSPPPGGNVIAVHKEHKQRFFS
jgi:FkbM family methyltransferase